MNRVDRRLPDLDVGIEETEVSMLSFFGDLGKCIENLPQDRLPSTGRTGDCAGILAKHGDGLETTDIVAIGHPLDVDRFDA